MLTKDEMLAEIDRLTQWVEDLQAGMYINCVYCGHRYGPGDEVPASMAEVLKEHVEQCPKHPMSELKQRALELEARCKRLIEALQIIKRGLEEHPSAAGIKKALPGLWNLIIGMYNEAILDNKDTISLAQAHKIAADVAAEAEEERRRRFVEEEDHDQAGD